jgi:hypothetical protein
MSEHFCIPLQQAKNDPSLYFGIKIAYLLLSINKFKTGYVAMSFPERIVLFIEGLAFLRL